MTMTGDEYTKWLRALRSGDWKKGKSVLGDDEHGYCCLGVFERLQGTDLSGISTLPRGDGRTYTRKLGTMTGLERYDTPDSPMCPLSVKLMQIPYRIREMLANVNDVSDTFDPVIAILEMDWIRDEILGYGNV